MPDDQNSLDYAGRDIIALVRDLTFPIALFLYVIGFSFRADYLQRVNVPVTLASESPYDFLYWVEQAFRYGNYWSYCVGIIGALSLFVLAIRVRAKIKDTDVNRRITIFLLVVAGYGTALVVALVASSYAAKNYAAAMENGGIAVQLSIKDDSSNASTHSNSSVQPVCNGSAPPKLANPSGEPNTPNGTTMYTYFLVDTPDFYYVMEYDFSHGPKPEMLAVNKSSLTDYRACSPPPPAQAQLKIAADNAIEMTPDLGSATRR
jgi:hypothetical protein